MLALILLLNVPLALSDCMACKEVMFVSYNLEAKISLMDNWLLFSIIVWTYFTSGEWDWSTGRPVPTHKFWRTTLQVKHNCPFPPSIDSQGWLRIHQSLWRSLLLWDPWKRRIWDKVIFVTFRWISKRWQSLSGLVSQRGALQTALPPVHRVAPLALHQGRWLILSSILSLYNIRCYASWWDIGEINSEMSGIHPN